jgi:hypothetical protein
LTIQLYQFFVILYLYFFLEQQRDAQPEPT